MTHLKGTSNQSSNNDNRSTTKEENNHKYSWRKLWDKIKRENISDWAIVLLTTILAYYSWQLFKSTFDQINISRDAVQIAQNSLRHQIEQDSINGIIQEQRNAMSDTTNSRSIAIANRAMQIADSSNKFNKEFLQIQTRAYVTIDSVGLKSPDSGKTMQLTYCIINAGNTPAFNVKRLVYSTNYKISDSEFTVLRPAVTDSGYILVSNGRKYDAGDLLIPYREFYNKFLRGQDSIYIAIIITYKDVFNILNRSETYIVLNGIGYNYMLKHNDIKQYR